MRIVDTGILLHLNFLHFQMTLNNLNAAIMKQVLKQVLIPARLGAKEVVVGAVLVDITEAGPVVHDRDGRGARGPDRAFA